MACNKFFFAILLMLLSLCVAALGSDSEYNRHSNPDAQKSKVEEEKLLSTMIAVQGLVYCRSGGKFIPLEGGVARITCKGEDEYGYETESLSILSGATDVNGYFLATLSPYEVKDKRTLKDCRAFLELSPSETCDFPTDINKGISGASLSSYRLLHDKNIKLFTVGPFFFVPQQDAKTISPDGY